MSEPPGGSPTDRDWVGWHRAYDDPTSGLAWRLAVIQEWIQRSLEEPPEGPIRVISMCAGQGRDLIGVLALHPRRIDVGARLVEIDPHNADVARRLACEAGLAGVEVVTGDAANTSAYLDAVPAHLILVCGVFGNIINDDIETTVAALPGLAAPNATVIWTRHRRPPDLTPAIRDWFSRAGFEELAFERFANGIQSVGIHRLVGPVKAYEPGRDLFRFIGYDSLRQSGPTIP